MKTKETFGRREFLTQATQAAVAVAAGAGMPRAVTGGETPTPDAGTIPARILGKTGLKLPILGYGGAALPKAWLNPLSHEDRVALVRYAYDRGLRYFDTAGNYRESQAILGEALKDRRRQVCLVTKVEATKPDEVAKAVERSLQILVSGILALAGCFPALSAAERRNVLLIKDAEDFTVVAKGVTFWFERPASMLAADPKGLELNHCRRVTIQGLKIDFDPPVFLQAKILEIDEAKPGYVIERSAWGLVVHFETWQYFEGPMPRNIQISGNVFRGIRDLLLPQHATAIAVTMVPTHGGCLRKASPLRNIVITGNYIERPGGFALLFFLCLALPARLPAVAGDDASWPQFRGPNGSGVANAFKPPGCRDQRPVHPRTNQAVTA